MFQVLIGSDKTHPIRIESSRVSIRSFKFTIPNNSICIYLPLLLF